MQSKKHSFIESLLNTLIGYLIAVATQLLIFPLYNIHLELHQNLSMAMIFTLISIARNYIIRRYFNKLTTKTVAVQEPA